MGSWKHPGDIGDWRHPWIADTGARGSRNTDYSILQFTLHDYNMQY